MKRFLPALAASLIIAGAASRLEAQNNAMSIRVAGYEIVLAENGTGIVPRYNRPYYKRYKGHIAPWEMGFNGFKTTAGSYSIYPEGERGFMELNIGRSLHITANLGTFSTSFTRNNALGLTMGIGISFNNYVFETGNAYIKTDGIIRPVDAGHALKKAKLSTFALHLPIAFEVNPTRNFFFSAGGYVDLLVGSHMKWKFPKEKLRGAGTNFVQAGLTARIGFRQVYFFGNYNLTELFKTGRGPVLNAYTFGIGFGY